MDKKNSSSFMIQVGGVSGGAVTTQMSTEDFIYGTQEHFDKIANVINGAGKSLINSFKELSNKPNSYSVEFGINIGGEAGIPFITKGAVGANFKVTFNWENN